jgi:ATP adenylyltransferase
MKSIMAPWRMVYIMGKKQEGCVFCQGSIRDECFVLMEGNKAFITMNRYPYTSGHLLIVPYRHVANFEDLEAEEGREIFDLTAVSIKVLKEAMKPEGFNIGVNIGKAGGAGVDDHVHLHVVPRWTGDTNFMTSLADTRVVPEDVIKTCEMLLPYFKKFNREA